MRVEDHRRRRPPHGACDYPHSHGIGPYIRMMIADSLAMSRTAVPARSPRATLGDLFGFPRS